MEPRFQTCPRCHGTGSVSASRIRIPLIVGARYGLLTITADAGRYHKDSDEYWSECRCDCGKTTVVRNAILRAGQTRSCGHLRGRPSYTGPCRLCSRPVAGSRGMPYCREHLREYWQVRQQAHREREK